MHERRTAAPEHRGTERDPRSHRRAQDYQWTDGLHWNGEQASFAINNDSSRQLGYVAAQIDNTFAFRCVAMPSN